MKEQFLNSIIEMIENNPDLTWHNFCKCKQGNAINLISKKEYKGFNKFLLNFTNYDMPIFLTYNQLKEKKLFFDKEDLKKFHLISFFGSGKKNDDENETNFRFLKFYQVYNIDLIKDENKKQEIKKNFKDRFKIETFQHNETEQQKKCLESLLGFCQKMAIKINHGKHKTGFYRPAWDDITMPESQYYQNYNEYLATLAHEIVHATGSRLNRNLNARFGSSNYSKEELIAEVGASLIMNYFNLNCENLTKNSSAYLKSWLGAIKEKPTYLITSFSDSQKALELILNLKEGENNE